MLETLKKKKKKEKNYCLAVIFLCKAYKVRVQQGGQVEGLGCFLLAL